MAKPAPMVERLAASRYYRRPTPGVVVLVNGQPTHFTGKGAARRAAAFMLMFGGETKPVT